MIKDYYYLTKPGIIRGNILTLIAGFLVGSRFVGIHIGTLIYAIIGTSLVVASSCVLNNILDADIDKKMSRTKNRALVKKTISAKNAGIFALVIGILGLAVLLIQVNLLTALLGLAGMYFYVVVYTYFKRKTSAGTLIGSISGSVPPLAGYSAASNSIDAVAVILFISMACWQMSHFYAIAIYRIKDYKKAGIPVLPAVRGMNRAKISALMYIFIFLMSCSLLYLQSVINELSLIIFVVLSSVWLCMGVYFFQKKDSTKWGKMMFLFSLIVIAAWCLILSIDSLA